MPVEANEIFPTEKLLDHIPALIIDVSGYLRAPEAEAIAANTLVGERARELVTLRHQLLREYQVLGGVLNAFLQEEIVRSSPAPSPRECVDVVARLHQSVNVLTQETVETFVRLYTATISEQAERLEQFTRMASREWRQPLGSLQFAVNLLRQASIEPARVTRTLDLMERNVAHLVEMTQARTPRSHTGRRRRFHRSGSLGHRRGPAGGEAVARDAMGGRVTLESCEDLGTAFFITLPRTSAAEGMESERSKP